MLNSDWLALVISFVVSIIWLRINDYAAHKGWISSRLSRKIIHIGTGPLFVVCWLLFPNTQVSRYMAALVPLVITIQFFLVGVGVIKDQSAVDAMTREGNPREVLRGPLFYGIVFVVVTVFLWYDTPLGIIALMLMCGGDGLAELLGTRYGISHIPWNPEKTWIGSLGMFIGGFLLSAATLAIYDAFNIYSFALLTLIPAVALIAFVGMIVETLPLKDIDNITVTFSAIAVGYFLL
jgi:phytol kinase